jgi:hypothetical protein
LGERFVVKKHFLDEWVSGMRRWRGYGVGLRPAAKLEAQPLKVKMPRIFVRGVAGAIEPWNTGMGGLGGIENVSLRKYALCAMSPETTPELKV